MLKLITMILFSVLTQYSDCETSNAPNRSFNFQNLFASKNFSTLENYEPYNPEIAKQLCPMIAKHILSDYPPEQNPIPKPSDCNPFAVDDVHAQMAYACNPDANGEFGKSLQASVVSVDIPELKGPCSGTVIAQQWVLTAGHCVVDDDTNNFREILLTRHIKINNTFEVQSIYVPQAYFGKSSTHFPDTQFADFALLRLSLPLPSKFKPIQLAQYLPPAGLNVPVWDAGFGFEENYIKTTRLRYRKEYYDTDIYSSSWFGGTSGKDKQFFVTGTIPTDNFTWTFTSIGDSGGPSFLYNEKTNKFSLLGVLSSGTMCAYGGFFAKLPYSYSVYTSVPDFYDFIRQVIDGTIDHGKVKSITTSAGYSLLVLNQERDSITTYKYTNENNRFDRKSGIFLDGYFTAIATWRRHVYVANYSNGTIVHCVINDLGELIFASPPFVMPKGSRPTDIKVYDNYLYVTSNSTNKILTYQIEPDGMLIPKSQLDTGKVPISISVNEKLGYVFVANQDPEQSSISIYRLGPNHDLKFIKLWKFGSVAKGELIKILSDNHDLLYLLTTTGVYIERFEQFDDSFHLSGSISHYIDKNSYSDIALNEDNDTLTISFGQSDKVHIYGFNILKDFWHITAMRELSAWGSGLAVKKIAYGEDDIFIANESNFNARSITMYKALNYHDGFYLKGYFLPVDGQRAIKIAFINQ